VITNNGNTLLMTAVLINNINRLTEISMVTELSVKFS
jgi:hypothetical protein